ncbi:MAG: glucokinase [Petroclostridium sp.]|jgi:glucokinase|uniref:ROK family protein n=1 Tax=Petroclostridium xylanilyticum TaxID=1792311 RepID=UPI000B9882E2|nr:ROK family protein [Petroclostridium xylanilyticum]MBZ4646609.1 glucokinase, family [Clostridia bacterium]MDK2810606.1 glucokinase [Petroclostridium sp.]
MYIGIDLGGTNIAVGLVDENGTIIHKDSIPTNASRHYSEIIRDMAQLSLKVIEDAGYQLKDIKSIGIGSPGTPNNEKGILVYANNLQFYNVPMREEMQKYIDLPVYIENDANCAALAEAVAGAAKDVNNSITITLGTGVGSGIIINKKIYSGFNYAGGELGHTVIVMDGEQCTCGRKGCWEAYASATGLIRQTREAAVKNPDSIINKLVDGDLDKIGGKTAFDAAKKGDPVGQKVVETYIRYLAEGIVNVINAFQPEMLVIGGGICKEGDYLLKPLRELVKDKVYSKDIPQTEIRIAQLGNDAGIIGAAMLGK